MSLDAVQEAASLIHDSAHDEANIILGAVINPDMEEDVRVTVIATGLEDRVEKAELPQIKKWTPKKDPITLKGSDRILSKSFKTLSDNLAKEYDIISDKPTASKNQTKEEDEKLLNEPALLNEQILPAEDVYDIPTFLRKKTGE